MQKNKIYIIFFLLFFFIINCKKEKEKIVQVQKEYYIVFDTSGSMAWGPFDHIKKRFNDFFSIFHYGDFIYILSFDKEPKLLLTIENYDESKKEVIQKTVEKLKPVGLYTDFQALIVFLKELVNQNALETIEEKEDKIITTKKEQYIIILTDGIDDPPKKRKKIDIKEYESKEKLYIQDRYVYYVSFSQSKSNQLESELQNISENIKTIERPIIKDTSNKKQTKDFEGKENIAIRDPVGIEEIKKDIELKNTYTEQKFLQIDDFLKNYGIHLSFLLLLVLLVLIIIYYFRKKNKSYRLVGELIFYESGSHPSMGKTIKLSRFEKNIISIGNDPSCLIRIRSSDFPKKIIFEGKEKKGSFYLKIPNRFIKEIQFFTSKKNQYIESGDKFKIKNYIFEYRL